MRRIRRFARLSGLLAAAWAATLLVPTAAAAASPPTVCDQTTIDHGEFSAITVGFYCELNYVHIDGQTTVPDGDILDLNGSTAVGAVVLGSGAQLQVSGSSTGAVSAPAVLALGLTRSVVHGSVVGGFDGGPRRQVKVTNSQIHGRFEWRGQTFTSRGQYQTAQLSNTNIGGNVELHGVGATIEHTTVGANLSLYQSVHAAELCTVHITGNVLIAYQHAATYLGAYADQHACTGGASVVVDGSLTIIDNPGVLLAHVVVNGDLTCTGNADIRILDATVRGTRSGQCA